VSPQQAADFVLEEVVRLTKSQVRVLGFVDEAGLWAEAIRQRRRIVINDYSAPDPGKKGYPEGHVRLLRLMAIPVFKRDRLVAVAAVGDKEEEYDEPDARQVTFLINGMWRLVQRRRAEEEIQ